MNNSNVISARMIWECRRSGRPAPFTFTWNILVALLLTTSLSVSFAHSADALKPGDNLMISGIPEIPDSIVDEANLYTECRNAHLASWHPVRKEMLISTRFADTAQIHQVRMPLGERKQLTFFKDSVSSAVYEPTAGDCFVFSKDRGGDENYQKYRFDSATGKITMLTDGKSRNTGGVWSNSGKLFAFESNQRNRKDMDIYVVNPKEPGSKRCLAELQGGGFNVLDWSPDDKTILAIEEISINEAKLWLFDVDSGKKTLIAPPPEVKEKVAYRGGKFSKDGKGIYTACDSDSEFLRLTYTDLTGGSYKCLTSNINWDIEDFDLSQDGNHMALITNEDGLSKLRIIHLHSGKERFAPTLPVGQVGELNWHKNNQDLGFVMETAKSPPDVYSFSIKTGRLTRWTESETGGINTAEFKDAELVKWKSWDGRTISGYLWMPPAHFSGKRPVLVMIHGGPESQARPGFMRTANYYINELGVTIIMPNVRGSSGYGKTFLTLDNGLLREGSYKDINALFDWIKEQPNLDDSRVMVIGGSYGGFMTLAIATNYADKIRCAEDIVGPPNLVTFLERTEDYRKDLRRVEYGDERDPKVRTFLESIAPRNRVDRIKKPLFVIQGKNDPRVPWQESVEMVDAVKKSGTPVWFLMANDEGHGFAKKKNSDYYFYSTIMFIKEYLSK